MTDARRLLIVRAAHTAIYVVMASAIFVVLYGGITGAHGPWLWTAVALISLESVIFIGAGMKCPLTAVAVKYGASPETGYDTFFPERLTRHTLRVFGPLLALGLGLVVLRWVVLGWAG